MRDWSPLAHVSRREVVESPEYKSFDPYNMGKWDVIPIPYCTPPHLRSWIMLHGSYQNGGHLAPPSGS